MQQKIDFRPNEHFHLEIDPRYKNFDIKKLPVSQQEYFKEMMEKLDLSIVSLSIESVPLILTKSVPVKIKKSRHFSLLIFFHSITLTFNVKSGSMMHNAINNGFS